jgi:gluconate 2-dehydrogenase gamma chain
VPASQGYTFLTPPEAAFVEAAVDVFVPADELTPSGTNLGLAVFIDRQLSGAWGKGDRLYRQGPWRQAPASLGYQLPLAPAEFFRMGLTAANVYCKKTYGKEFDHLTGAEKQKVLEGLDQSTIVLDGTSGKQFFDMLYQATMEGMFADPIYGGNRNKAAWKMIGYPGVIAVHATNITTYKNKRYVVDPVSIADLE